MHTIIGFGLIIIGLVLFTKVLGKKEEKNEKDS